MIQRAERPGKPRTLRQNKKGRMHTAKRASGLIGFCLYTVSRFQSGP